MQAEGTAHVPRTDWCLKPTIHQRPYQWQRETDSLALDRLARHLHWGLVCSQTSCLTLPAGPFSDPASLTAVHWGVKVTYTMALCVFGLLSVNSTNRDAEMLRSISHLHWTCFLLCSPFQYSTAASLSFSHLEMTGRHRRIFAQVDANSLPYSTRTQASSLGICRGSWIQSPTDIEEEWAPLWRMKIK